MPKSNPCMIAEITDLILFIRPELFDVSLLGADEVLYMDGSNFTQDGIRYAGVAILTKDQTTWAQFFS